MATQSHRTHTFRNQISTQAERTAQTRSFHLQMSGVVRKPASFDQDLAQTGQVRTYGCDLVDTVTGLAPIYRETTITTTPDQFDRTPWWERDAVKPRQKRS